MTTSGPAKAAARAERTHSLPRRPYSLVAIGSTPSELVRMAGGLICDRALAGWTVTAVVTDPHDDLTPLKILGAKCCTSMDFAATRQTAAPYTFVLSTRSLEPAVLGPANCAEPYDFRHSELLFYGEAPTLHGLRCDPFEHQASSASRAFKIQALAAAGVPAQQLPAVERFLRSSPLPNVRSGFRHLERAAE